MPSLLNLSVNVFLYDAPLSMRVKQIAGYHNEQRHMKRIGYLLEKQRTFMTISIERRGESRNRERGMTDNYP